MDKIEVKTVINTPLEKAWKFFVTPIHVQHWNFAHESWECPKAENTFEVDGEFHYLMAAKDGSMSFDFWGTYTSIILFQKIISVLGDGRQLEVIFNKIDENTTEVIEIFDPESENPIDMQREGWNAILQNFKKYTEETTI